MPVNPDDPKPDNPVGTPLGDPRSDADLLRAYVQGDAAAFDTLYARHRNWAAGVAARFTRTHDDALDVLQDAFSYLMLNAPTLRLHAPIRALLYPVIKHNALARLRRSWPASLDDESEIVAQHPFQEPSASDESLSTLRLALAHLPVAQREVLLMSVVDGMSHIEIAAALLIPIGTVKSRLYLALRTLRESDSLRAYFGEQSSFPQP